MRLGKLITHDAIVIYLVRDGRMIPQFVQGESFRLFSSLSIPFGQGLSGWVAENDRPIVNGNPAVEAGYLNDPTKITTLRSAISVPLMGRDQIMGVLSLYSLQADAFNQDNLRILLAIRSKAGMAIENSLRFQTVKSAAERDELTGLHNVGSLFRLITSELAQEVIRRKPLTLIVLDLDGFKRANDIHGHLAGNRILQEVANSLIQLCRPMDSVARLGGDEFVLLLREAEDPFVADVLRRIHEIGPEAGREVCGEPLITISAGVARSPQDGFDANALLEKADQRMYEVKRSRASRRVA